MDIGTLIQQRQNAQRVYYLRANHHLSPAEALHVFMDERQAELQGEGDQILMQKPEYTEISDCC